LSADSLGQSPGLFLKGLEDLRISSNAGNSGPIGMEACGNLLLSREFGDSLARLASGCNRAALKATTRPELGRICLSQSG